MGKQWYALVEIAYIQGSLGSKITLKKLYKNEDIF